MRRSERAAPALSARASDAPARCSGAARWAVLGRPFGPGKCPTEPAADPGTAAYFVPMPQSPDDPVDVTVRLHRDIYEKLEEWARSVFDEEPGDFLHLLTNTLMADQALRERIADTYLGGA
jgi:hypothetical protein